LPANKPLLCAVLPVVSTTGLDKPKAKRDLTHEYARRKGQDAAMRAQGVISNRQQKKIDKRMEKEQKEKEKEKKKERSKLTKQRGGKKKENGNQEVA